MSTAYDSGAVFYDDPTITYDGLEAPGVPRIIRISVYGPRGDGIPRVGGGRLHRGPRVLRWREKDGRRLPWR